MQQQSGLILLPTPPFWNKSLAIEEQVAVGLRSAFVAPYYAAAL